MQKQITAPIAKATAYFLAPPTRQCQVAGTSSVLCTCLLTPFNVQLGHQSLVPSSAAPPFQFISASHGMPVSIFSIPPSLSVMPVSLHRLEKKNKLIFYKCSSMLLAPSCQSLCTYRWKKQMWTLLALWCPVLSLSLLCICSSKFRATGMHVFPHWSFIVNPSGAGMPESFSIPYLKMQQQAFLHLSLQKAAGNSSAFRMSCLQYADFLTPECQFLISKMQKQVFLPLGCQFLHI